MLWEHSRADVWRRAKWLWCLKWLKPKNIIYPPGLEINHILCFFGFLVRVSYFILYFSPFPVYVNLLPASVYRLFISFTCPWLVSLVSCNPVSTCVFSQCVSSVYFSSFYVLFPSLVASTTLFSCFTDFVFVCLLACSSWSLCSLHLVCIFLVNLLEPWVHHSAFRHGI